MHGSTLGILGMGRIGQSIAKRGGHGFGMQVTYHSIGAAELAQMKPSATLVNIARDGIVDDAALVSTLRQGLVAAAGLDVFEGEPVVHPDLLTLSNVVLTRHIASASIPTRRAMANLAADNLIGYLLHDTPLTPLNPQVLTA